MQRRPPGLRRPARSLLPGWTWWLLAVVIVLGFVLFVLHHRHQDPVGRSGQEITKGEEVSYETLNMTQELLSSTSFARQLVDQMTLAKAYVILAKEHGNLDLAWKFSSQIRNCQRLLSRAAVRGKPITLEEAHPVVSRLSELIYKAQDLHFDISTTITTLKKHVQALEERVIAAMAQSAAFGQLAVETTPKSKLDLVK